MNVNESKLIKNENMACDPRPHVLALAGDTHWPVAALEGASSTFRTNYIWMLQ